MDSYSPMERSRAASQAPPQPPRQLPPYRRSSRARSLPPNTPSPSGSTPSSWSVAHSWTSGKASFDGTFVGGGTNSSSPLGSVPVGLSSFVAAR
eukprot:scaffold704_cov419-Pavlova_lutheri.AAC.3